MDTHVVGKNQKGQDVNRDGEVVLACKTGCGRKTTMDGTKLCDFCWEADRRAWWRQYTEGVAESAAARAAAV